MKITLPLYLIAISVLVIALQNAGIIPPMKTPRFRSEGIVAVQGSVDVDNTVDVNVSNTVDATVSDEVDVNLASVADCDLVTSKNGMYLGVKSTNNTIIPIHWGEMSISR